MMTIERRVKEIEDVIKRKEKVSSEVLLGLISDWRTLTAKVKEQQEELSKLKLDYLTLEQQADEMGGKLRVAVDMLEEAKEMVSDWGGYASEYFQEKHNLKGDIQNIDEAITTIGFKKVEKI